MTTQQDVLSAVIPQLYYDSNSNLVDLLEAYYRWLDGEFIDVSQIRSIEAQSEFVERLIDELTPGIEKVPQTNRQLLLKHATDLYKAKGTPAAIELFFKLVYQVNAAVDFPRDELIIASSADYRAQKFVEVTRSDHVDSFAQQFVITSSGGVMYVESVQHVRSRVVLVVSNIVGSIQKGDAIYTTVATRTNASRIIGSLSSVTVTETLPGFITGQPVVFQNSQGSRGHGYVSGVESVGTEAVFELESNNIISNTRPEITVSDYTIRCSNTNSLVSFETGDTFTQTLYEAEFDVANAAFTTGPVELRKYSGVTITSSVNGTIVAVQNIQSAGARLIIQSSAPSANIVGSTFAISSTAQSNAVTTTDATAEATVVGVDSTATVVFSTNARPIIVGDSVYQYANNVLVGQGVIVGTPAANQVNVDMSYGILRAGTDLLSASNAAIVTPIDVIYNVGVEEVTGTLYSNATFTSGTTTGVVADISEKTEVVLVVDSFDDQHSILVESASMDSGLAASFNNNYFDDGASRFFGIPVGVINSLQITTNQNNLSYPPIAAISATPLIAPQAYELTVSSTEGFVVGETVKQTGVGSNAFDIVVSATTGLRRNQLIARGASEAIGIISSVNPVTKVITVIGRAGDVWTAADTIYTVNASGVPVAGPSIVSSTSTSQPVTATGKILEKTTTTLVVGSADVFLINGEIVGVNQGSSQTVSAISNVTAQYPDLSSVVVTGRLVRSQGGVATVVVQYASPNFVEGETVDLLVGGNVIGRGRVNTSAIGSFEQRFVKHGARPSGTFALFDGNYYQHLSYNIKTPVDLHKYPNNKQFLQIAGMKMFFENEIECSLTASAKINSEVESVDV